MKLHTTQTRPRNVRRILVRGSMPPCCLRRRKFGKLDYKMVHSEEYLNKYVVSTALFSTPACPDCSQKYNINIENLFFACFRFLFFHPFYQGSADPICPYMRTPMTRPRLITVFNTTNALSRWLILCQYKSLNKNSVSELIAKECLLVISNRVI